MINKRYLRYFDWINFSITILMLFIGNLFVWSATYHPETPFSSFFISQCTGSLIGLGFYFFFSIKDLRTTVNKGYFLYGIVILLLIYTITCGATIMGARRWISVYFFRFQTAELAKLFLPVFIACYAQNRYEASLNTTSIFPLRTFLIPLGVIGASFMLVLKQPDLGTALIIMFSGISLLWFIGIPRKFLVICGIALCLGAPFLWKCLKPYQQQRILVLMGYGEARNERYQIEQSKIAIGSGGLYGKGLLKGMQNKLEYLPEDHTDFIFSVICEEWGLMGALLILLLFIMLFLRIAHVIATTAQVTEQIIAFGLFMPLLFSVCVNIGMVIGILPIVGVPLPLFSYGRAHLWVNLISLGWLNNIAIRRFYY